MAEGATKGIARSESADDLDRVGREPFANCGVATMTPSPPSFTIAASRPRSSMRSAASSGSSVPTATSHSLRLPIAMVTWSSIGEIAAWACSSLSQNIGRQSRSSTVMLPVATLQQFGDGRPAAVEREPARRDPEDARRVDCVEKLWRGLDLHVGSGRLSIEDDRRILWRVEFGERQRCFQGRMGGDEARVDIERVPQGIGDVPAELVVADAVASATA